MGQLPVRQNIYKIDKWVKPKKKKGKKKFTVNQNKQFENKEVIVQ